MVFKNLFRRKGRTLLTILGISIGVATIIALGTMAEGLQAGYSSVLSGTEADFVLSDPEAIDITMSALDEDIGQKLDVMPEVESTTALLQGMVQTEETPYFFVFGYPKGSFALDRFQIIEGYHIYDDVPRDMRGKPLVLGSGAAQTLDKNVGDTLRLVNGAYRVIGIYETGDAFEEAGAILRLEDAQPMLGMQRQVSLYYIKVEDPALSGRLQERINRLYPELSLSTGDELSDRMMMTQSLQGMVWGIAALAIVMGGVSMTNAQLMSVYERTREIGVLRAIGWKRRRVLSMILGESLMVSILGGLVGLGLSYLMLIGSQDALSAFGASTSISTSLLIQAFSVVLVLGMVGGIIPAWRASRLEPIEALRYEGGSAGEGASRLPVGGMALQNLWRRKARTVLTISVLTLTIGSVTALNALMNGITDMMGSFAGGSELAIRQRDAADTSIAFIDERIGDRIAAMDGIETVSGMIFTATQTDSGGFFIISGYAPFEPAIQKYQIVEGKRITTNRQIMLGRSYADSQNLGVGDFITLGEMRFKVVGIYESSTGWEELGGVITLRDAQNFAGRQRKVTFFMVDLENPNDARIIADRINARYPEVYASLSGEFANELPDMQNSAVMVNAIILMAVVVGGIGMMNTMLMAVLERTREIGVLRALGWRRRRILGLIMRESLILCIAGAITGVLIAFGIEHAVAQEPNYGELLAFIWSVDVFTQTITVALVLSVIGGIYPAWRATRMQPVEALRYE